MNNLDACLLGIPGLYQNWLLAATDTTSNVIFDNQHNFICKKSRVKLIKKFDLSLDSLKDATCSTTKQVINLYVEDKNFVWYLYNFLEKTDGVGIKIDNLEHELFFKANGTVAFDFMLKHFVESCNISSDTDINKIKNLLIEYFYFLLINSDCDFKQKSSQTVSNAINIEYTDFQDVTILVNKLQALDFFDKNYFKKLYQDLHTRNNVYLQRKQMFEQRFILNKLDLLETSYVGYLITRHTNQSLDWFNLETRNQCFNDYRKDLLQWHNN
jgi:hypothetical protein